VVRHGLRSRGTHSLVSGLRVVPQLEPTTLTASQASATLLVDRIVRPTFLSGSSASLVLGGREGGRDGYWPRMWATRGLLYASDEAATGTVVAATTDTAWRVREMAAKVIAFHRLGEATHAAVQLQAEPDERVRAAEAAAHFYLEAGLSESHLPS
jgi:hypothetical protein